MSYEDDGYEEAAPSAGPGDMTVSATSIKWDAQKMFDSIARIAAASIVESVEHDLKAAVISSVKEHVSAQVGAKVAEVLDTNIQPTTEWGEAKGPATSLREIVARSAREYMAIRVNKEGSESSYHADRSRLEYLVQKEVEKTFNYQMQSEVKKAVEMARAEAVAKVGAVVGDMIVKLGK